MGTFRLTEADIAGKKPLAVGYKIFNNDWSSEYGNYCYADESGNIERNNRWCIVMNECPDAITYVCKID